jgi:O-antigen/teichoic acid export membrane protein
MLLRMLCQAGVLVLSARLLGVENYGLVAAVVAISLLLGPWSGLGCDFDALRAVARDRDVASLYFWHGVRITGWTAMTLIMASLGVAWLWLGGEHLVLIILVLVAELICLRITELIAKIFQGAELFHQMAATRLSNSLTRLPILAVLALAVSGLTATEWAWAYLATAIGSLGFSVLLLHKHIGIGKSGGDVTSKGRQMACTSQPGLRLGD